MNPRGWVGLVLAVVLSGLIVGGFLAGKAGGEQFEITLPLLAMFGVLLIALALTSVAFAAFGLADNREALALPPGSVRAVIALGLVVIFAILTIFLYADLSSGSSSMLMSGLTVEQQKTFVQSMSADERKNIYVVERTVQNPAASNSGTAASPAPSQSAAPATVQVYDLHRRDTPNSAAQDFAKQLLILLGTLLSSVTGFYFGAKTVTDKIGQKAPDANPPPPPPPPPPTPPPTVASVSKLASAQDVVVTEEAAALGHDPSLASQSTEGS